MRVAKRLILCLFTTAQAACAQRAIESRSAIAITHVTVVDVLGRDVPSSLLPDQTVVVAGRRVELVGPSSSVRVPPGAVVVEGRGKYLIPGLWDAHAHISVQEDGLAGVWVANGVTTVRDLGYRIPHEIRAGREIAPRLFASGPVVEGAWWLDEARQYVAQDSSLKGIFEAYPRYRLASPGDATTAVDSLIRLGADLIKFRFLRGDEVRALASAARRRGIPLVGHAPQNMSIGEAADSGMRSIEHAETITPSLGDADEAARRAQFEHLARAGTAITPTLMLTVGMRLSPDGMAAAVIADSLNRLDSRRRYLPRSFILGWTIGLRDKREATPTDWVKAYRRQLQDMRLAHDAGVRLLVGADAGDLLVYPGFSIHEELRLFVDDLGLSPLEALRGATIYPAQNMGVADSMGTIAPGKVADLVLLDSDPLADIGNTARIRAVVLAGRLLQRPDLDQLLARAEQLARASWQARH